VLNLASGDTPGPGTYGDEQHPLGGILTGLQRSWPGVTAMSSFGTNANLPTLQSPPMSNEPGPGQYDVEDSSRFLSRARAAQSPFLGAARMRTGSRLQRDLDLKLSASFASTRPAHKLPMPGDESGAAIDAPAGETPGPDAYLPSEHTIGAHMRRGRRDLMRRHDDGAHGQSFTTTAERFGPLADQTVVEPDNPGPGAHTLPRYSGDVATFRRPRSDTTATRAPFLVNARRFGTTDADASSDPDAVLHYLAYGPTGTVGRPVHAQRASATVAKRTVAAGSRR